MATETTREPWSRDAAADESPALRHLWQVPTFLAGLLAVIAICAARPRQASPLSEMDQDIAAIRKALAQRNGPVDDVLALAQNVLARTDQELGEAGEAQFLLGSIYLRLADQGRAGQADQNRQQALFHLEQAEKLGVPAPDQATLNYRLGKVWFQSGKDPARVVAHLAPAVADADEDQAEGYRMLSQAYMHLPVPNLDGALSSNMKLFALPIDDEKILGPARLTCGEILYKQKKQVEALKMLGTIAPDAPRALRARALYLQGRCCQEKHLWAQAIPFWEEVLRGRGEPPGGRGQILYYKGVCYHNLEPPKESEAAKAWSQALKYEGENGQAAALSLADLYLSPAATGSPINAIGALEVYRKALAQVKCPADYKNTLIDLKKTRKLLERGCDVYRSVREFDRAVQLVEIYKRIAPPGAAEDLEAQLAEAWALDLKDQPPPTGKTERAAWEEMVNAQFLAAGTALQVVAASRSPKEQAKLLWRSAACLLNGKHYARAVAVLEQYLRFDVPADRGGEGWFKLAEGRLAMVRLEPARKVEWREAALEAYEKATHSPGPFAFRARYQLALTELEHQPLDPGDEKRHLDRAEDLLWQNVEAKGEITAERDVHEKSLYQLAGLFFRRRNFDQAHIRLQEAVEQYPNNPYILQAREKLAECFYRLADQAVESYKMPDISVETQLYYRKQSNYYSRKAMEVYEKLEEDLEPRREAGTLSETDQALLRRASFAAVDLRYELGDYNEAMRRSKKLADMYAKRVECLTAFQNIFRCAGATKEMEEARNALQHAADALETSLKGLPDDAFLHSAGTGMTRVEWSKWVQDNLRLIPGTK